MGHYDIVMIRLTDIERVDRSKLKQSKLDALQNGYDSFESQLRSERNPIALDKATRPYRIIDGRHRIYLARQKGYSEVPATFA